MGFWERFMSAMTTGLQAGLHDWKNGPQPAEWDSRQQRYIERYLLSRGELFLTPPGRNEYSKDQRIYRNTSLLWDHVSRIVQFYETMVYKGGITYEANKGSIPIVPDQSLNQEEQDALLAVLFAMFRKWNWAEQKSDRVVLAARVGECMTEIEDNLTKRFPQPRLIWPGYVKDIELDQPGNVEWYVLEYQVQEKRDDGTNGDTYTYRKEVDNEAFRYYKNDKPFDYGDGSVVPNPYGFAPAIWDRFRRRPAADSYGDAAADDARQAIFGMNSLFSHARDFQHKAFFAPIVVGGRITKPGQVEINLSTPSEDPSAMAEALSFLEADTETTIHQATFDTGQTLSFLELMRDGILGKAPEATFFEKMADAANITGPGADRIILPVAGRLEAARTGFDARLVRAAQMSVTIGAMRARRGDWGRDLDRLRQTFLAFDETSFDRGKLDFGIRLEREIVPSSLTERIEQAQGVESLSTRYGLTMAQVPEDQQDALLAERRARESAMLLADFGPVDGERSGEAA